MKRREEKRRERHEVKRKVEIDGPQPAKEGTKTIALALLVATPSRDTSHCGVTRREPSPMVHIVKRKALMTRVKAIESD